MSIKPSKLPCFLKATPKLKDRILNCPNCGAPINGEKCEYCGTRFKDDTEDELILYADNVPIFAVRRGEDDD